MGFPTMKESDCLVRKALGQFKWSDADEHIGGQALATGAKTSVTNLVDEAKTKNLAKPVVKVGIVGKNLVFRIKHDGGHYGKDDVLLVKGYVRAAPEMGAVTKAMLKSSKQKNMLSRAWWNDVRGDLDPGALGRALDQWEGFLSGIGSAPESETNLGPAVATYIVPLEKAAAELRSKLAHKDDQGLIVRFENEVSQARDVLEKRVTAFRQRQAQAITDATREAGLRRDNVRQAVSKAEKTILTGDVGASYRDFTLVKQISVKESPEDILMSKSKDAASVQKVDVAEVFDAVDKTTEAAEYRQAVAGLVAKCRDLLRQIGEMEDRSDPTWDHPDQTASQDPEYRKKLASVNGEYKHVLTTIDSAKKTSIQRATATSKVAAGVKLLSAWDDRVPTTVLRAFQAAAKLKSDTISVYAGIRNESGEVKKRVAEAKITTDDKAKYLTPILNKCMARWYEFRDAEAEFFGHAATIADELESKFPAESVASVKLIREAVSKARSEKD